MLLTIFLDLLAKGFVMFSLLLGLFLLLLEKGGCLCGGIRRNLGLMTLVEGSAAEGGQRCQDKKQELRVQCIPHIRLD